MIVRCSVSGWLGFECFPSVHVVAELGSIGVNGATRTTATDEITGWITAQGLDGRPPMNWRESAEHMLKHLCSVLGFARGAPLPAPMSEFYEGDTLEVTFHETGGGFAPLMPPLPHLNLRPIVETAVNNIAAIDDYQDIFEVAVGWLLVPTDLGRSSISRRNDCTGKSGVAIIEERPANGHS